MAILYRSLTIDRLWELLEAHQPFTDIISAARRVKDTPEGWLRKLTLRSVGDFPHVQIEMGDAFTGGGIPTAAFGDEGDDFGTAAGDYWLEERTSEFKISFIYEKPGFDQQDALEMAAIEALEAAGRNLGYDPVKKWGPWRGRRNGTAKIPIVGVDDDTVRPVTQIVFPVTYEFTGSQLKPS